MIRSNLKVKCYSGYIYAERPVSLEWDGIEYEIVEIEKEIGWSQERGVSKCEPGITNCSNSVIMRLNINGRYLS